MEINWEKKYEKCKADHRMTVLALKEIMARNKELNAKINQIGNIIHDPSLGHNAKINRTKDVLL